MKVYIFIVACFFMTSCKTTSTKSGVKDDTVHSGTVEEGGICKRDAICKDGLRCRMRNLNPDTAGICVKQEEPGVKGEVCGGSTGVICHKTLSCRLDASDPAGRGYCVSPIAISCPDTESLVRSISSCQTSSQGKAITYKSEDAELFHICQIDRALIDVWSLFRTKLGYKYKAPSLFLEHPSQTAGHDEADEYCQQLGGKVVPVTREGSIGGDENTNIKLCSFNDCSSIYVETLQLGPSYDGNKRLTTILKHEDEP